MQPGGSGPEHRIDVDQVWVVLSGALICRIDGSSGQRPPAGEIAGEGDAVVVPAGVLRQFATSGDQPVTALVSMPAGGHATLADGTDRGVPPWAV
jgi:mannose-6-phosphate isomerase-like protein (cupin superfamily)